jgi:dUTP pyrophosphatase
MSDPIHIGVRRIRPDRGELPLPRAMSAHASGMDVCADVEDLLLLEPGERVAVPTGLALEIPPGYEVQVRPRSGLALKHGVTVLNAPGTIDADYRGEVRIILANLGREPYAIQRGERIAQLVPAAIVRAELVEVAALSDTDRGAGGFGSTGSR